MYCTYFDWVLRTTRKYTVHTSPFQKQPPPPELGRTRSRAPTRRAPTCDKTSQNVVYPTHRPHINKPNRKPRGTHQNSSTLNTLVATGTQDSFRVHHHHPASCEMSEEAASFPQLPPPFLPRPIIVQPRRRCAPNSTAILPLAFGLPSHGDSVRRSGRHNEAAKVMAPCRSGCRPKYPPRTTTLEDV